MKEKYKIRKAVPSFPAIDLLPLIQHKGRMLDVAVFGSNTYKSNRGSMSQNYFHSKEMLKISFRPATTSESISIASHGFNQEREYDAKKEIFDPRWLQTGYIVRTQDGIFVNTKETNESKLKQMLDKCEKVNGIFLGENDLGFAPYETFETGDQDSGTFIRGGLARALEHTKEKVAENLGEITSRQNYKRGVNVWAFNKVNEPILRVATLDSGGGFGGGRLDVYGGWNNGNDGYAFGVLSPAKNG